MAMHLDHISISTTNLYYGAHRLRLETGLSFYDGGFFAGGNANRIFHSVVPHTLRSVELSKRRK